MHQQHITTNNTSTKQCNTCSISTCWTWPNSARVLRSCNHSLLIAFIIHFIHASRTQTDLLNLSSFLYIYTTYMYNIKCIHMHTNGCCDAAAQCICVCAILGRVLPPRHHRSPSHHDNVQWIYFTIRRWWRWMLKEFFFFFVVQLLVLVEYLYARILCAWSAHLLHHKKK